MARASGDPRNKTAGQGGGQKSKGGGRPGRSSGIIPFEEGKNEHFDVPELPNERRLLKVTRQTWDLIWMSGIASQLQEQDSIALYRWIEYVDEWHRSKRALKKADRIVPGSRGQMVLNPLIDYVLKLESAIRAIEDRLGLSPMARARLGLTLGEGASVWQQLNQQLADADAVEQDEAVIEISDWKNGEETG